MTDSGAAYRRYLPLLTVGDRVAVITPSGPPDPEQLNRGCEALRSWGLHPVLGARVDTGSGMTAGSDSDRVADLEWALTAPDIAAVFCGRGGYGLVRILDHIRWAEVARATPRAVVAFSDISQRGALPRGSHDRSVAAFGLVRQRRRGGLRIVRSCIGEGPRLLCLQTFWPRNLRTGCV